MQFERLLAEISTFFINLPADRIDSEIDAAQRRICEFLDLDRSSLFQVPEGEPETLLLTHFHQPAGSRMSPERMSLKEFFPWALPKVMGGETITISKMTDLPAEAVRDRETFGLYGTRSVVAAPLSVGRREVFGLLTFSVIRGEREWTETEVQQFKLVAQILLLNKYARHTENIYCTFSAEKNIDIINKIFILKFHNDALVDAYKNGDPVVDHPGFRLNEFLNNELA